MFENGCCLLLNSVSLYSTLPLYIGCKPTIVLINVDFPAPFDPSKPIKSPLEISIETESKATKSSYLTVTSSTFKNQVINSLLSYLTKRISLFYISYNTYFVFIGNLYL